MQRQLYLDDTYLFEARTAVHDLGMNDEGQPWLILGENIFHPQGGGQPADVGRVEDVPVVPRVAPGSYGPVVRVELDAPAAPWGAGTAVLARIDPEQRRRHAALHTAGHLVDAVVRGLGLAHRANNHFPGQARIEFYVADVASPDVTRLAGLVEEQAASAIVQDRRVEATTGPDGRAVAIDGMREDPCGGTHVPSLGCIAGFTIRSVQVKKGVLKVGYAAEHAP